MSNYGISIVAPLVPVLVVLSILAVAMYVPRLRTWLRRHKKTSHYREIAALVETNRAVAEARLAVAEQEVEDLLEGIYGHMRKVAGEAKRNTYITLSSEVAQRHTVEIVDRLRAEGFKVTYEDGNRVLVEW
jgi:Tfp pilus assembly protein FimT